MAHDGGLSSRLSKVDFPKFNGTRLNEWLSRWEQFFISDRTPLNLRTLLACSHMEGVAFEWYQTYLRNRFYHFPLWHEFRCDISSRFGDSLAESRKKSDEMFHEYLYQRKQQRRQQKMYYYSALHNLPPARSTQPTPQEPQPILLDAIIQKLDEITQSLSSPASPLSIPSPSNISLPVVEPHQDEVDPLESHTDIDGFGKNQSGEDMDISDTLKGDPLAASSEPVAVEPYDQTQASKEAVEHPSSQLLMESPICEVPFETTQFIIPLDSSSCEYGLANQAAIEKSIAKVVAIGSDILCPQGVCTNAPVKMPFSCPPAKPPEEYLNVLNWLHSKIVLQYEIDFGPIAHFSLQPNRTIPRTCARMDMMEPLDTLGATRALSVGGIEAEAAILGQPMSRVLPGVLGSKLDGKLRSGVTASDLVFTVTQILREHGVVGKFVLSDELVNSGAHIGAPDDQIQEIEEAVELPLTDPELYENILGKKEELVELKGPLIKSEVVAKSVDISVANSSDILCAHYICQNAPMSLPFYFPPAKPPDVYLNVANMLYCTRVTQYVIDSATHFSVHIQLSVCRLFTINQRILCHVGGPKKIIDLLAPTISLKAAFLEFLSPIIGTNTDAIEHLLTPEYGTAALSMFRLSRKLDDDVGTGTSSVITLAGEMLPFNMINVLHFNSIPQYGIDFGVWNTWPLDINWSLKSLHLIKGMVHYEVLPRNTSRDMLHQIQILKVIRRDLARLSLGVTVRPDGYLPINVQNLSDTRSVNRTQLLVIVLSELKRNATKYLNAVVVDSHVPFDIRDGQVSFICPTFITPFNIDMSHQLACDNSARKDSDDLRTFIVLPPSSKLPGTGTSITPMLAGLCPPLHLFLPHLKRITIRFTLTDFLVFAQKKFVGVGIIKISHEAEEWTWLVVPQPTPATTLGGTHDLKVILRGDLVLQLSKACINRDSHWDQWLLSKFPNLFVNVEKSFSGIPCHPYDPGNLLRIIISTRRSSNHFLKERDKYIWVPPWRVLRNMINQVLITLPDGLLLYHSGKECRNSNTALPTPRVATLRAAGYGPDILLRVGSSLCYPTVGIDSLGFERFCSGINELSDDVFQLHGSSASGLLNKCEVNILNGVAAVSSARLKKAIQELFPNETKFVVTDVKQALPADIAGQMRGQVPVKRGSLEVKKQIIDIVFMVTDGRLPLDKGMMNKQRNVKRVLRPTNVFLIIITMTVQEAAVPDTTFNIHIEITGAILAKLVGGERMEMAKAERLFNDEANSEASYFARKGLTSAVQEFPRTLMRLPTLLPGFDSLVRQFDFQLAGIWLVLKWRNKTAMKVPPDWNGYPDFYASPDFIHEPS